MEAGDRPARSALLPYEKGSLQPVSSTIPFCRGLSQPPLVVIPFLMGSFPFFLGSGQIRTANHPFDMGSGQTLPTLLPFEKGCRMIPPTAWQATTPLLPSKKGSPPGPFPLPSFWSGGPTIRSSVPSGHKIAPPNRRTVLSNEAGPPPAPSTPRWITTALPRRCRCPRFCFSASGTSERSTSTNGHVSPTPVSIRRWRENQALGYVRVPECVTFSFLFSLSPA